MKLYFKIALFIAGITSTMQAQVGVQKNNPDKAAALDLSGTNKGLLIPRISLSSVTATNVINGSTPAQSLMVYNTNDAITGAGADGTGYYYWDTSIWKKLVTVSGNSGNAWQINGNANITSPNFLGTTDSKDFVLKTNNTERLRTTVAGNVGIGKVPQLPYKLDVNGSTRVDNNMFIGAQVAPEGLAQLVIGDNGEIMQITSLSGNTSSYSYVKYTIENVDKNWIDNFDTKIPINDYVVTVVGSRFYGAGGELYVNTGSFAPYVVNAFKSGTTWKLTANYTSGYSEVNGNWDLYLLILNNRAVKTLPDQNLDLGGSATGSFSAVPSGL